MNEKCVLFPHILSERVTRFYLKVCFGFKLKIKIVKKECRFVEKEIKYWNTGMRYILSGRFEVFSWFAS